VAVSCAFIRSEQGFQELPALREPEVLMGLSLAFPEIILIKYHRVHRILGRERGVATSSADEDTLFSDLLA